MFDFNKSFGNFVKLHMKREGLSASDAEEIIPDLSIEWSMLPQKELDGKSPLDYIESLTDPKILVDMLARQAEVSVMPQLSDKIARTPSAVPYLEQLLTSDAARETKQNAYRLLLELNSLPPAGVTFKYLLETVGEDDIIASYISWMGFRQKETVAKLLEAAKQLEENQLFIIGEILSHAEKNKKVYNFLVNLLIESRDIPQSVPLIARYGDERAVPLLKELAEDCNYIEYLELRNAVEILGGELLSHRDWSNDEYYEKLKG